MGNLSTTLNICQNCGSKCTTVLDLGEQPICNRFLKSKTEFRNEKRYPLGLVFCPECMLVQLPLSLPTEIVFTKDFNYLSGSSKDVVKYFGKISHTFITKFGLNDSDYVVDIGSNDGTFLKPFKEKGIKVIGVDPAKIPAKIANRDGIYTIPLSFEEAHDIVAKKTKGGKIRLFTAFNVIAHTGDINGFLDKVSNLLDINPNAVFVSQSHYLPKLIENCEFDTIYMEHQRFYTVTSMQNLFNSHHLYIYDCEEVPFYGGSILVYASHNPRPQTKRLKVTLRLERRFSHIKTYMHFRKRVEGIRSRLLKLLEKEKANNHKIIGVGAPMKSSTLLNYCQIDRRLVDYLTETNFLKIGTYSPGTHLKIIDEKDFLTSIDNNPNTDALLLSWNMKSTIVQKLRKAGFKGKFIIPIPKPELIR